MAKRTALCLACGHEPKCDYTPFMDAPDENCPECGKNTLAWRYMDVR